MHLAEHCMKEIVENCGNEEVKENFRVVDSYKFKKMLRSKDSAESTELFESLLSKQQQLQKVRASYRKNKMTFLSGLDENSFYRLFDCTKNRPHLSICDANIYYQDKAIAVHEIVFSHAGISIDAFNQQMQLFPLEVALRSDFELDSKVDSSSESSSDTKANSLEMGFKFNEEEFLEDFLRFLYIGAVAPIEEVDLEDEIDSSVSNFSKERLFNMILFARRFPIKKSLFSKLNGYYLERIIDDVLEGKPIVLPENQPLVVDAVYLNRRKEVTQKQLELLLKILDPKQPCPSFEMIKCEKLNDLDSIKNYFSKVHEVNDLDKVGEIDEVKSN